MQYLLKYNKNYFKCIAKLTTNVPQMKRKLKTERKEVKSLSRVWLFATPWTVAYQASLSMGFSRQEYWSGLPFPSPGDLPDPGNEPGFPALEADALTSEPPGKPNSVRETLIFSELLRKTSLKKEHLSWDLNDKKDKATQVWRKTIPHSGITAEVPEARLTL